MVSRARGAVAALLGGLFLGSCGGSGEGGGAAPPGRSPGPAAPTTTAARAPSASPRWETVTKFTGSGVSHAPAFDVLPNAIQWRARWRCDAGALRVTTDPPPRRPAPLVDSSCPNKGEGFSIVTGKVRLAVDATGPWELVIDQQVDTPLDEPPIPGMDTATVLGQGDFYDIDMRGKGTARLYLMPDGSRAVRFEGFEVPPNTDLFVWLSTAPSPRTSAQSRDAPHRQIGNLKSTSGNQNYVVPADLPTDQVRSVVIWCEPVAIAYAAASLGRP